MKPREIRRSECPVACALDLVGDRWTLLVVRDLFYGKTRFKELQESDEGIPSNILSDRLQKLERAGLVVKKAYRTRPVRYAYHLNEAGRGLAPVMEAIVSWAVRQFPGTRRPARRS